MWSPRCKQAKHKRMKSKRKSDLGVAERLGGFSFPLEPGCVGRRVGEGEGGGVGEWEWGWGKIPREGSLGCAAR